MSSVAGGLLCPQFVTVLVNEFQCINVVFVLVCNIHRINSKNLPILTQLITEYVRNSQWRKNESLKAAACMYFLHMYKQTHMALCP